MTFRSFAAHLAAVPLLATPVLAESWPDLPVPLKNGFAAQIGESIYAGLGSAGQSVFRLDLADRSAGWVEVATFVGPAPNQPATAVVDQQLYVFSGSGKSEPDAPAPIVFDTVYRYDPASNSWSQLATTAPAGLLGASAAALTDGTIAIFGGYNKALFDSYLADITAIDRDTEPERWSQTVQDFMGMEPEAYRWNDLVLIYDPVANIWSTRGRNPDLPNTGAALVEIASDSFLLANGEIKPGLRTDVVKQVDLAKPEARWTHLPPLPSGDASIRQEGVAGAFAGRIGESVIIAGGANFTGARAAADSGRWFAHEGLPKSWASDIFQYRNGTWSHAGVLPQGLAYGASLTLPEGILLIGGEDNTQAARREVSLLTLAAGAASLTP